MRWLQNANKLVELVNAKSQAAGLLQKNEPTLWDPRHDYYYNQGHRFASLRKIDKVLSKNGLDVTDVDIKLKLKNLRATFVRESKEETQFKVPNDNNEDDVYAVECAVDVELLLEGEGELLLEGEEESSSLEQIAPTSLTDTTTSSESESQSAYIADSAGKVLSCTSQYTADNISSVHKRKFTTGSTLDDAQLAVSQKSPKIVPETEPLQLLPQIPEDDDSSYFAKCVAITLRKFDDITREEAKLAIQSILLDCMRKIKQNNEICNYVKTENHWM